MELIAIEKMSIAEEKRRERQKEMKPFLDVLRQKEKDMLRKNSGYRKQLKIKNSDEERMQEKDL